MASLCVLQVEASAQLFTQSDARLGSTDSYDVEVGDLDGDDLLDVFVVNSGHPGTQPDKVWLGDGQGGFEASGQDIGNSNGRGLALGDLDGDGDLDAFVTNAGPDTVWLNDGAGFFEDTGQRLGDQESHDVVLGDLDEDGDLDAVIALAYSPTIVLLNNGEGLFTDSGQTLGDANTFALALGDLNGDGHLDLWEGNNRNRSDRPTADIVWFGDGEGRLFDSGQRLGGGDLFNPADATSHVRLRDFDGDGDLDCIVGAYFSDWLFINDGQGQFETAQEFIPSGGGENAVGDFDHDGDIDLLLGRSLWLNSGGGLFELELPFLDNLSHGEKALGDFDRDGNLDIYVAMEDGEPDQIWFGSDPLPRPTADPQSLSLVEDTPTQITLSGNGQGVLTYRIAEHPDHGRVSDFDDRAGTFVYTPDQGYTGEDTLAFFVRDEILDSLPASVSLTILAENNPPEILSPSEGELIEGEEGEAMDLQIVAVDPDGDALSFSASALPEGAELDGETGELVWTPSHYTQAGRHDIVLRVTDGEFEVEGRFAFLVSIRDRDEDGLPDSWEREVGLDPERTDSDQDGISDTEEVGDWMDPLDTDGDGVLDALDTDSDEDGVPDSDDDCPRRAALGAPDGCPESLPRPNLPPSSPSPISPVEGEAVAIEGLTLTITNGEDPEGDALTYTFSIYAEGNTIDALWTQDLVPEGDEAQTRVVVGGFEPPEGTAFSWVAVAVDERGLQSPPSEPGRFSLEEDGGEGEEENEDEPAPEEEPEPVEEENTGCSATGPVNPGSCSPLILLALFLLPRKRAAQTR